MVYELRHEYPVSRLLALAGVPRSTYYYHAEKKEQSDKNKAVKNDIKSIYDENKGRYGYRRITLELHNRGMKVNHKKVLRLMKEQGLYSRVRIRKYNSYRGEIGKAAPNLLNRDFSATAPNQKWVTDVTEIQLFGQKLYLSPILDLFNGEIVSYDISYHPDFRQIKRMLSKAFERLPEGAHPTLHSDQGWQYRMEEYQKILCDKGITQSMSRKATCLDNAVAENFFSILKTELLYLQEFSSVQQFINELENYLHYYNHQRIKLKLKTSPVQFRLDFVAA